MTLSFEACKALKAAGFPQHQEPQMVRNWSPGDGAFWVSLPLIDGDWWAACPDQLEALLWLSHEKGYVFMIDLNISIGDRYVAFDTGLEQIVAQGKTADGLILALLEPAALEVAP